MSASAHTRVFRRLIDEGFNGSRLAVLDDLLTADFVDHSPYHRLGGARELRERIAEYWGETADLLEQLGIIVP